METFRCIHASRLLLDHQLQVAGEFHPAAQKIVTDASLIAFDRLIDEALLHEVDCLLISGDCFDPADHTLRGPAALLRGITRLAERDIAVIFHSASRVWSAWPPGLRWPPHAHRLGLGFETSVHITREGQLRATVFADSVDDRHVGWQVQIPNSEGAGSTFHVAEDPMSLVGQNSEQAGPHGCTFLEIDRWTGVRQLPIPVAPVRWERCEVSLSAASTRDDLLHELALEMERAAAYVGEQVRLVTTTVLGDGPLFEQLAVPEFSVNLCDDLKLLDPVPGVTIQFQAIKLQADNNAQRDATPVPDLATEFTVRLNERLRSPATAWREALAGAAIPGSLWESQFESLSGIIDAGDLASDVRRLARHCVAAEEE
jgi:hypothetical protein